MEPVSDPARGCERARDLTRHGGRRRPAELGRVWWRLWGMLVEPAGTCLLELLEASDTSMNLRRSPPTATNRHHPPPPTTTLHPRSNLHKSPPTVPPFRALKLERVLSSTDDVQKAPRVEQPQTGVSAEQATTQGRAGFQLPGGGGVNTALWRAPPVCSRVVC